MQWNSWETFTAIRSKIIGGLHLKLPDSIDDENMLKHPLEKNKELVKKEERKISSSVFESGEIDQGGNWRVVSHGGILWTKIVFWT